MDQERARAQIEATVQEAVGSGAETGLQVAVIQNGRVIADATAGTADPGTGAAVSGGTLFYAASTAKGVASTVAHVLAERGEISYDLRAADVWPEFGAHGKGAVTLRAGNQETPTRRDAERLPTGTSYERKGGEGGI